MVASNPIDLLNASLDRIHSDRESAEYHFQKAVRLMREQGPECLPDLVASLATSQATRNKRQKRRLKGMAPRPENEVAKAIRRGWLPQALWCQTSKAIQHYLWPFGADVTDQIDKAISELGYTASRRRDHSDIIDLARENWSHLLTQRTGVLKCPDTQEG
jgi:hypothetical protein